MDDQVFFGDLYVLSLPSFRWLRFNEIPNPPNARTRHSCHVVNERHLFIVGGGRNDSNNANLKNQCVWDELSVLDMTGMEWLLEYTPNKDPYVVNDVVRRDSLVRGLPRTEPEAGWSPGVEEWFQSQNKTNNGGNNSQRSKLFLIVGVVVGSLVAAGIFLIARFYYYRHRRNREIVTEVTGYKSNQIGIASGTQALPRRSRSDSLEGGTTGLRLELPSGGANANHSVVSEMPADSEIDRTAKFGGNIGWAGPRKHAYAPLSTISDDSGPYLTPVDGPSFASELDASPGGAGISYHHEHDAGRIRTPTLRVQSSISGVSSLTVSPKIPSQESTPRISSWGTGSETNILSPALK